MVISHTSCLSVPSISVAFERRLRKRKNHARPPARTAPTTAEQTPTAIFPFLSRPDVSCFSAATEVLLPSVTAAGVAAGVVDALTLVEVLVELDECSGSRMLAIRIPSLRLQHVVLDGPQQYVPSLQSVI